MTKQEFIEHFTENLGNGDAAELVLAVATFGTDISSGVLDDNAVSELIDTLATHLNFEDLEP